MPCRGFQIKCACPALPMELAFPPMRLSIGQYLRALPRVFICLVAISCGCRPAAHPSADDVIQRLCQHITDRKTVIVDNNQPDNMWSDGAMLEVATDFPAPLAKLISQPTRRH